MKLTDQQALDFLTTLWLHCRNKVPTLSAKHDIDITFEDLHQLLEQEG